MEENNQQPAAPAPTPTPAAMPVTPATPAPAPATATAPTPTPAATPAFDVAAWDKQKKMLNKKFVSTFSPRLLGLPFSLEIDKLRAKQAATAKKYQVVDQGMTLLTPSKFWGKLMVEVTDAEGASGAMELGEVFTMVTDRPWPAIDKEIPALEAAMGAKSAAVYIWPATATQRVLIATFAETAPAPAPTPTQPAAPAPTEQPPQQPQA